MTNLTDKQQEFLDVLFEEAGGDFTTAKRLAGYSSSTKTRDVVDALSEEIAELTRKHLARGAARAAFFMVDAVTDTNNLVQREKLAAAKELLDRAGFNKTDKVEVKTESPLFILPPKDDE
jgi:hypothetical protein